MDRSWFRIVRTAGLATLVALAGPALALAATISGTVTAAEDDAVLPGVVITAIHLESGVERMAVTGDEGGYTIDVGSSGNYRVVAFLDGFAQLGQSLQVTGADAEESLDFTLTLGALEEEITITAARGERSLLEVPQAVTVVSAKEIQERNPQGTQEAFERVPNMQSIEQNPARSRPTYRGQSSSRLLLLLDGERVNNSRIDANATGLSPGMIDVTQLQAVEVVGGAGSSLYGTDAHAGIINLITKAPSRPSSGATLSFDFDGSYNENGGFNRQYAQVGYGTQKWGLQASISRFDQDDYEVGGDAISRDEVIRLGELSNLLAGNANTYAVWELGENGEVRNGQGEGTNGRFDLWYYLNDNHSVRGTYLLSEHEDLGFTFAGPPFSNNRQTNEFRDFNKLTLRYEGTELSDWMPRISARVYDQTFERPQNDLRFTIDEGSSFVTNPDRSLSFTGNTSTFTSGGTNSETLNDISSQGGEVQINLAPASNALITTGIQYLKDESRDSFTRNAFDGSGTTTSTITGATTPDTDYENTAAYAQLEWRPHKRFRLGAGIRYDEWESTAMATDGYPLPGGSELGFLGIAVNQLSDRLESEFNFNLSGVPDFVDSIRDGNSFSTSNDTTTSNIGMTFFLPGGVTPFVRWGESYREPEVTVRYLVRNFGSAFFGVQSVPNPFLEPEEGESIDFGVKVDRSNWRASATYFETTIENYIDGIVTPTLFFQPDPANGVFTPVGLFFQRINATEVEFEGFEAYFEGSFALGDRGSLTPYVSLSWLDSRNKNPTPAEIDTINEFYNRSDLPIRLEGSAGDAPFGDVVPFQGTFALRYANADGRWFTEYEYKFADDITRVRPESVASGNITQFGILKSLDGYDRHGLRGGYEFRNLANPVKLTLGIENITDELYFQPFQLAPAPGRSFVLGVSFRYDSQR